MPRKMVLFLPTSRKIGSLDLPRAILVRLLNRIHGDLAIEVEPYRTERASHDPRVFRFNLVLQHQSAIHAFSMLIDDSTSPDHFFLMDIHYAQRNA